MCENQTINMHVYHQYTPANGTMIKKQVHLELIQQQSQYLQEIIHNN